MGTTEAATEFTRCVTKSVVPSEKITIKDPEDNTTICVSEEPINLQYCEDAQGRCKMGQARNMYYQIQSWCKCCLPVINQLAFSFDCWGEKKSIKIDVIETCNCVDCDSPEQRTLVEDLRRARQRRDLSGVSLARRAPARRSAGVFL